MGIHELVRNIDIIPVDRLIEPSVMSKILEYVNSTRDYMAYGIFVERTGIEPLSKTERELFDMFEAERMCRKTEEFLPHYN